MVPLLLTAVFLSGQSVAGSRIAGFTAQRLDGNEFRYDTSSTGHAAFYFWTPKDPLCREDIALLDSIQQRYARFNLTTVTALFLEQDGGAAARIVSEHGSRLVSIYGTPAITKMFLVREAPSFILIGPHGRVDTSIIGGMPEDFEALLRPVVVGFADSLAGSSERAEKAGDYRRALRFCNELLAAFAGDSVTLRKALYRKFWCFRQLHEPDSSVAAAERLAALFPGSDEASRARSYAVLDSLSRSPVSPGDSVRRPGPQSSLAVRVGFVAVETDSLPDQVYLDATSVLMTTAPAVVEAVPGKHFVSLFPPRKVYQATSGEAPEQFWDKLRELGTIGDTPGLLSSYEAGAVRIGTKWVYVTAGETTEVKLSHFDVEKTYRRDAGGMLTSLVAITLLVGTAMVLSVYLLLIGA
jgi:hypothetical protein